MELGGGTTIDMGVYAIQVSQWAFREEPLYIKATGTLNADRVDIAMKAELTYSGGRKAKLSVSAMGLLDNKAVIRGTKGEITIHDFWCPIQLTDIDGTKKTWPVPQKAITEFFYPNSCGLFYEAEVVRRCVINSLTECDVVSHKESLLIARIEDEIRKQIGVKYAEDEV